MNILSRVQQLQLQNGYGIVEIEAMQNGRAFVVNLKCTKEQINDLNRAYLDQSDVMIKDFGEVLDYGWKDNKESFAQNSSSSVDSAGYLSEHEFKIVDTPREFTVN